MRPHSYLPWLLLLATTGAKAELACGDFLAQLGKKPAYLVYQGCKQDRNRQSEPYTARYWVHGRHAYQAEAYLRRNYGLPQLKHYCCIWDSTPHFWRDRRTGIGYMLSMATGEELGKKRADWPTIDTFYVNVDAYAEDP